MDLSDRHKKFETIKEYFDTLDREGLRHGKLPMHTTDFGFWGTTNMNDAYTFFSRIKLNRFKGFIDLGCGDGRVALIASLFTTAVGIEGNQDLADIGNSAAKKLNLHTQIKCKNYYTEDLSNYDIIFMFPDKQYDAQMIGKLLSEFKGFLFVYNRIYTPPGIKAGKTYWLDQMPIASYPFNVEDENLERYIS